MGWPGPVTYRQYRTWMYWFDDQWNKPSRTDYYLMQIDNSVKRVLSQKPNAIKLHHSKLDFKPANQATKTDKAEAKAMTKEQATAISKSKWLGMMTMPVVHKTMSTPMPVTTSSSLDYPPEGYANGNYS